MSNKFAFLVLLINISIFGKTENAIEKRELFVRIRPPYKPIGEQAGGPCSGKPTVQGVLKYGQSVKIVATTHQPYLQAMVICLAVTGLYTVEDGGIGKEFVQIKCNEMSKVILLYSSRSSPGVCKYKVWVNTACTKNYLNIVRFCIVLFLLKTL